MANAPRPPDALLHRIFDVKPSKGDLRKVEIIEAAIRCFATQGTEQASLENIGKLIGISRSHIIYHFKDRETLLDAVVKYVTETGQGFFVDRLAGAAEFELLDAYIDAVIDWVARFEQHARFMILFEYFSTFTPRYRS